MPDSIPFTRSNACRADLNMLIHAHGPFVRIQRGLIKFIPHGLEPHPTGLVLLVRKRQDFADSLGPFGQRAPERPLRDGLFVERVRPGHSFLRNETTLQPELRPGKMRLRLNSDEALS